MIFVSLSETLFTIKVPDDVRESAPMTTPSLYSTAIIVVCGKKDISFINEIAKQKCSWQELQIKDNQIQISPSQELSAYEHLIYKIYNSTIETLTQFKAKRIKKCSACQWLFYDTSKNSSRKWCVMEDCGNRDKVNRFNKRKLDKGK